MAQRRPFPTLYPRFWESKKTQRAATKLIERIKKRIKFSDPLTPIFSGYRTTPNFS